MLLDGTAAAPRFRVTVEPSEANGLKKVSQVMLDKPLSVKRDQLGKPFGRIEDEAMPRVNRALAVRIGLAQGRRLRRKRAPVPSRDPAHA